MKLSAPKSSFISSPVMILLLCSFEYWALINKEVTIITHIQGRRERTGWGAEVPGPTPFPGTKTFFPRKIGRHKICMYEYLCEYVIYWTRHKCQKVDSSFWICCFGSKLTYHSYQQRVCKFLFLIRTFIKSDSNLMCGSI